MEKQQEIDQKYKAALDYHSQGRPGKIEVRSTKPFATSSDLSLAYTPGVAAPCLEIAKNSEDAYKYTAKGNLVAVVSNGTAVLGLGDIGALAGKPVMEGKGILFKRFADIDVFDIEINAPTIEEMVNTVKALEPTFGGINLEDIKAPECFEVERILIEKMNIPVFHDDQHGTAIIASAGFLNALEITKRKISEVKCVFSGAGAAAIACAKLFIHLGVRRENLIMCDSQGAIYQGRTKGMNKYKDEFAVNTYARTLADAFKGADVFIGCSAKGLVSQDMIKSMAKDPIVFAMANPDPEIYPDEVLAVRKDAIVATGRSDFPNQVNNVLGFPFIFRGALDVRATQINMEMKLAAVRALAALAKEDVPDEVKIAYGGENFTFGRNYLIPKPFDRRVLTRVAPAVARAAMESGVAKNPIKDFTEYALHLESRLSSGGEFLRYLRDNLRTLNKQLGRKITLAFAEGEDKKVLQAVKMLNDEGDIEPILLGRKDRISDVMKSIGLEELLGLKVIEPVDDSNYEKYSEDYCIMKQREGVSRAHAYEFMSLPNYFGAMMAMKGHVDAFMNGPSLSYPECFSPLMKVVGTQRGSRSNGIYIMAFKQRVLFFADCTAQINPKADDLSEIAASTAQVFRDIMKREPRVAFLSFSNFGSNEHSEARKVKEAVRLTKQKYPDLICDGEMQADVATNPQIMKNLFSFCTLDKPADILIFPDLNSANISYKLLTQLSEAHAIGPLLVPMAKTVNIIARTASASEIVNMSILTAIMAHKRINNEKSNRTN
ncbi:MAG: NADP-dependent malic enzyme [Bdellovibrio sp.]|nr:NADP-dependent malic enzyme [Bdellovibrio sp.]